MPLRPDAGNQCFYPLSPAFRHEKKASHLLKQVTDCRIITRLAADEKLLTEDVLALLRQDILASDLYRMIWNRKYGSMERNEYQHSPLLQV